MNFYIYKLKHFQIFSLSIQKVKLTFDMHNSLKKKENMNMNSRYFSKCICGQLLGLKIQLNMKIPTINLIFKLLTFW